MQRPSRESPDCVGVTIAMATHIKGLSATNASLNGKGLRILIVHTRWNLPIVTSLVEAAKKGLIQHGVDSHWIDTHTVAGCFELPLAAKMLIDRSSNEFHSREKIHRYDAVICIGVLIKGDTMHFEYIAEATSHGIMRAGLDTGVPCIFGVLTCLTEEQAMARAGMVQGGHNHGEDWATTAIEMALLRKSAYS